MEALSSGLPVVAYDRGGVGDIVVDGREGFLVGDARAFAVRVSELAADPALRARMAEAGRTHVRRFAWPGVIDRHLGCYRAAIAVRHAAVAAVRSPAQSVAPSLAKTRPEAGLS